MKKVKINIMLVGRLTKDIKLKKTNSNISTCTFTLACDKKYKKDDTDFIQCVAWGQSAEFLNKYATKGSIVGVEGSIQTRSYDGQNGKVYVTEVVCDEVNILSPKKNDSKQEAPINEEAVKQFAEDNNASYVDIKYDDLQFY